MIVVTVGLALLASVAVVYWRVLMKADIVR